MKANSKKSLMKKKWKKMIIREAMHKRKGMIINTMKRNVNIAFVLLCITLMFSCVPPSDKIDLGEPIQDLSTELAKKIYTFQDTQNFDSLQLYISSPDPMARFCATRAFGSFVSPLAVPLIKERLQDSIREIRTEAAYVAGQLRDTTLAEYVLQAFESDLTQTVDHELNKNVLEAIGKIGPRAYLSFLASSSPYDKKFEKLNAGKALAFYNFALRGLVDKKATEQMLKFATEDYPGDASIVAANYLHRAKDLDLENLKFQLLQGMKNAENPAVRMALATAVGKTGSKDILTPFLDHISKEKDSRVVVNAVRQFGNFKYINIIDKVLNLLSDKNEDVALSAVSYIKNNGQSGDAGFYLQYVDKISNPTVQIALKGAILGLLKRNFASTRRKLERQLTETFNEATNDYTKASAIQALGSNPYLFQSVHDLSFNDSTLVVRTKGVEAIGAILTDFLPNESRTQQRYLAPIALKFLHEALEGNDVGMIAAASYSIGNTDPKLVTGKVDRVILESAIAKLSMPKDLEAINYCVDAINKHFPEAKLDKKVAKKVRNFDAKAMEKIADDITAVISTSKGDITVDLFKGHAPSSVMNFVDLAQEGYYSNKFFHRVVPNFVVQAGCPRGDGFGSEDYVIRSELSPMRYLDEGYLGMASAGKHTESTQWFITHSPTPHLSGSYTIFGKVKTGMNIVHKLAVGDKINDVKVINIIPIKQEQ